MGRSPAAALSATGRGPADAVSTASSYATAVAAEMLARGGNAVDAAVAAAWMLAVVEQSGSGLGGQTTALVRLSSGEVRIVDGHSHAPRRATLRRVTPAQQMSGPRACTVPSTPATLDHLARRFGRLSASEHLLPAAVIAETGFHLSRLHVRQLKWVASSLREDPATARMFLNGGRVPPAGSTWICRELADTLHSMASDGVEDFYRGRLARRISADMRARRGLLDEQDLAEFSGPAEREPAVLRWRRHLVWTVPHPAGGSTLLRALEVSARLRRRVSDPYLRRAVAVRDALIARYGVEDGEHQDGEARSNSKRNHHSGETTHLTVADREGNVVCLTQSIQSLFGAKVANASLGFLYNNYLSTCRRQGRQDRLGDRNAVCSNAAPALVTSTGRGHRPRIGLGGAGSRRIISSLLNTIEEVIEEDSPLDAAVCGARAHGLTSNGAWIERPLATRRRMTQFEEEFDTVTVKPRHDYSMGCIQAVGWSSSGQVSAAADPRREGTAWIGRPARS